jgi:hypothetical protein
MLEAGKVRLRPNRGFPFGLARQRHPHNPVGLFDHFFEHIMPSEQDVEISLRAFDLRHENPAPLASGQTAD